MRTYGCTYNMQHAHALNSPWVLRPRTSACLRHPSQVCSHVSSPFAPASFRRVYDALNVLRKLSTSSARRRRRSSGEGFRRPRARTSSTCSACGSRRAKSNREMKLRALVGQFVAFRQLIERNKRREKLGAGA